MTDTDLATWLLAAIDEEERVARETGDDPVDSEHQARWNPARVLAECEAKRIRIELHGADRKRMGVPCKSCFYDDFGVHGLDRAAYPCDTLKAEALPYVDRPGFDERWRL